MTDLERFKAWSETITAEDFRTPPDSPGQEAWRHMWQAVAIVLREGKGISGALHLLSRVIYEMEVEE